MRCKPSDRHRQQAVSHKMVLRRKVLLYCEGATDGEFPPGEKKPGHGWPGSWRGTEWPRVDGTSSVLEAANRLSLEILAGHFDFRALRGGREHSFVGDFDALGGLG